MGLEIHPNRGRKVAKKLFDDFHHGDGILGHNDMPEDIIPESIGEGSLEHLLFITLTTSIDYMRNADSLWESSRNTYEDPSTQYLFDPESLHKTPNKKIQRDMQKYGLAKKNKQDPWIWTTVGVTFYKKWEGNPRNFLSYHNWDAPSIRAALSSGNHPKNNTQEKDFPYLGGPKISSLWLRMLRDTVKLEKLHNMQSVPIPVDVHTARATFSLGVIQGETEESFAKTSEKIREAWFESVENLEVNDRPLIPLDVDQPLWHLSKYGCAKRNPETGECPIANKCAFNKHCLNGKIRVSNNKVQLNTS